ncbi:MAG: c-type cytochrome [Steroidobacteraceae bacterium]|jgi:cytochrome c553
MKTSGLRLGEKILFGIAAAFVLLAVMSFIGMEIYRARSNQKMYVQTTHFDFSPDGLKGSERFRDLGCTNCHRAVRNGTNNGVSLDGIGSRRTPEYLTAFLHQPESTYGAATMDHGADKGADYVARLPEQDLRVLAVFLSELKATQGSPDARMPSEGHSGFIDEMVKIWAPSTWKTQYKDVREEAAPAASAASAAPAHNEDR